MNNWACKSESSATRTSGCPDMGLSRLTAGKTSLRGKKKPASDNALPKPQNKQSTNVRFYMFLYHQDPWRNCQKSLSGPSNALGHWPWPMFRAKDSTVTWLSNRVSGLTCCPGTARFRGRTRLANSRYLQWFLGCFMPASNPGTTTTHQQKSRYCSGLVPLNGKHNMQDQMTFDVHFSQVISFQYLPVFHVLSCFVEMGYFKGLCCRNA